MTSAAPTAPASGRELLDQMEDLGSPVGAFVRECCAVGAEHSVSKSDLYQRWTQWCAGGGREHYGDVATFGRNLLAVVPTVKSTQPRDGGKRTPTYVGIGLSGRGGSTANPLHA
jgi:putative DNA primase/helicase